MSKLTIEVEMDNSAFEHCKAEEVNRILNTVKFVDSEGCHILRDYNGNTVGKYEVKTNE